jgi:hypothetical protein
MLDQVPAPGLFVGFPESSFHYGQIDGKIISTRSIRHYYDVERDSRAGPPTGSQKLFQAQ